MESSTLLSPARGIARLAILVLVIAPVAAAAAEELPIEAHWIGPETPVSAATGVLASDPDVAATPDGHALVVWQQAERYTPAATRALARLRRPDGSWSEVMVIADGPLVQPPTVTAVGPYAFVVTWADADGAGVRIVDTDGEARPRVTLRPELGGTTALWRALLVPPGRLMASWSELVRTNGPLSDLTLRSRLVGSLGKPVAPGNAIEEGQVGGGDYFAYQTLELGSNGMAAVAVWHGEGCYTAGPGGSFCASGGARAARLGLDGSVLETFDLSLRDGSTQTYRPALATVPGGQFVVAWEAQTYYPYRTRESGATGILVRRLDTDGRPAEEPMVIDATPDFSGSSPTVALDADGHYLVAWNGFPARARAVDARNAMFGGELVATTVPSSVRALAALGTADYLIVALGGVAGDGNGFDYRVTTQRVRLAPALLTLSSDLVTTDEDGTPASFEVSLRAAPTAPVNLALRVDPPWAAEVAPPVLVFTADDWAVPQTVTVRGRDDGLLAGDTAAVVTTMPLVTDDSRFARYDPPDVRVRRIGEAYCAASVGYASTATYWATGRPVVIPWQATGDGCGTVRLDLLRGNTPVAHIADNLPPRPGGTTFAPPSLPLAADYRVRMTMPSRPHLVALSEPFWAGPAIACATGVATPREGEQWQRGRPHRIRWHAIGSCAGRRVRVLLDGHDLVQLASTERSFLWHVPANLRVGVHDLVLVDAEDPRARSLPRYFQVTP